jgi:hypothetical protein
MMGGRGGNSKYNSMQRSAKEEMLRIEIEKIKLESDKKRISTKSQNGRIEGGPTSSVLKRKCACCGELTITIGSKFETCPNCGWIDDPYQNKYPNSLRGRNPITLAQARKGYANMKKDFLGDQK